ncbi:MAG: hypothetical protein ABSG84_10750 [Acidobacteriaceae bacterium]|jgi:hypothetical protein
MRRSTLLAAIVVPMTFLSFLPGQIETQAGKATSAQTVQAVVQAVEDEIYDLRDEDKYFMVDNQGAGNTTSAKISIYISKELSADGDGVAVYKLMPYGEVYRYFVVRGDGLVVLSDDPHKGFLPNGGSMLTVYMSDEDVCAFISRSIQSSFLVDPEAPKQRLDQAVQRQLKRTGFSYRQYSATHAKKK